MAYREALYRVNDLSLKIGEAYPDFDAYLTRRRVGL